MTGKAAADWRSVTVNLFNSTKRGRSRNKERNFLMDILPHKLNAECTAIFKALTDHLNDGYLKICNEPFMPLIVEAIGTALMPPLGEAKLYSLCHYYKQNGDLMQDPEMCFALIEDDTTAIAVYPYMYQQAMPYCYQESIVMPANGGHIKTDARMQKEHVAFGRDWLMSIKAQGYLEQLKN